MSQKKVFILLVLIGMLSFISMGEGIAGTLQDLLLFNLTKGFK